MDNKLDELERDHQASQESGLKSALAVINGNTGKKQMDRIRAILEEIKADEQKGLRPRATSGPRPAKSIIRLLILIGVPVCAIASDWSRRESRRPSISCPVNEMAACSKPIADGDLGVIIPQHALTEEIQKLAKSFTGMVASLRQSASLSERIASGDLTVKITPQSEKDIVGQAQQGMVGEASELVEQVQRFGVQVNSSAVQIAATSKQQQSTATGDGLDHHRNRRHRQGKMSATSTELLKAADNVNAISQQLAGLARRRQGRASTRMGADHGADHGGLRLLHHRAVSAR